jgi:hypothetical protein
MSDIKPNIGLLQETPTNGLMPLLSTTDDINIDVSQLSPTINDQNVIIDQPMSSLDDYTAWTSCSQKVYCDDCKQNIKTHVRYTIKDEQIVMSICCL